MLAGGIAHDFNNFLTVVQGNLELAKARLDTPEPVQEILGETAEACRRAAFLSSQLLTFAKGGAPVRRQVPVARLIEDAIQLARAGSPVSIVVSIAEDLGYADVDPDQIGQVLYNILRNAQEAMPLSGIIEVRADRILSGNRLDAEPRVRISIRDYGCGIAAEVLPRIFDPYFTTKTNASGMGLATAYSIVAKHGGHISVESKTGDGTTFTVELSILQETLPPLAPVFAQSPSGTERLLVMDDEEALRKLLETVLAQLGYHVQTARDGAEAVTLYEQAKLSGRGFDAVLLDLTVRGGMGGIEAAAKLKELDPSSRLIVSSGYSGDPVMSEPAKYGFDAVIRKPWTVAELTATIRRVLVGQPERQAD